jgi:RimJ/RimL family protein N-acetyltransferase
MLGLYDRSRDHLWHHLGARAMTESTLTDLELAEIELDALFTHNEAGRIVMVNEPEGDPAPRFVFVRTRQGNDWRLRHDVDDRIAREIEALAACEPVHGDLFTPPVGWDAMAAAFGDTPGPGAPEYHLSYRFPDQIPAFPGATRITLDNVPVVDRMWDADDAREGLKHGVIWMGMVVDGGAVSLCYSCRLTERAAEAGLETMESYRGRGYAPAVTAAWARAIRDSGRIPFYSTSWDNLASQAVARKLGLVQFAVSFGVD